MDEKTHQEALRRKEIIAGRAPADDWDAICKETEIDNSNCPGCKTQGMPHVHVAKCC